MAASAGFLGFLEEQLGGLGPVSIRRMFSGAGVFADGIMFALVSNDTLYFKADETTSAATRPDRLRPGNFLHDC